MKSTSIKIDKVATKKILTKGINKIAPLWSLENFVAVNPYMGMADMSFEATMDFLQKTSKAEATLPVEFYLEALKQDRLTKADIKEALHNNSLGVKEDVDSFLKEVIFDKPANEANIKTMMDVASEINGKKWRRFVVDRISFWASAYFDNSQAIWDTAKQSESLFTAWKREAEIDFSTEAMGLSGFRKLIKDLPDNYTEAAAIALENLKIEDTITEAYLNALLMKMNGWTGFTARIDWDARLEGKESHAGEEFLAILLVWEMCLQELLDYPDLDFAWVKAKHESELIVTNEEVSSSLAVKLILQKAFDIANQRNLLKKINDQELEQVDEKTPKVQAIFCIDVRSEIYRRNLEAANTEVETLGFAGFFGFPVKFVPLAYKKGSNQCPALITTSHIVKEDLNDAKEQSRALSGKRLNAQVSKAWKSFKTGAVSCFGFVSPVGLSYLPKLFSDSFGITSPLPNADKAGLTKQQAQDKSVTLEVDDLSGHLTGIPMEDRIKMAQGALKAMSLTENFARIVLIAGHGASTINNPHATGLNCGACGGQTGEANAKVAANILNDPEVRSSLKSSGIEIPETTVFLAGLHDTTTDKVTVFTTKDFPHTHDRDLVELKYTLELAGQATRKERASRMKIAAPKADKQMIGRSKDWSQIRPEWGLAGCSSFIVAPRNRTSNLNLDGKAFMHNYNWQKDAEFGILEVIMTAPMVVTSWINLQYYASTVDNRSFGAGNKILHNVVGGLGVLEGFAGDLKVGLPWQSLHDGEKFQHEPQRLNVIIEAPVDEMSKILEKHQSIRNLCDNEWIYLFAMNEEGKVAYKYIGDLEWEVLS